MSSNHEKKVTPKHVDPPHGGRFVRDPQTGELTCTHQTKPHTGGRTQSSRDEQRRRQQEAAEAEKAKPADANNATSQE